MQYDPTACPAAGLGRRRHRLPRIWCGAASQISKKRWQPGGQASAQERRNKHVAFLLAMAMLVRQLQTWRRMSRWII